MGKFCSENYLAKKKKYKKLKQVHMRRNIEKNFFYCGFKVIVI